MNNKKIILILLLSMGVFAQNLSGLDFFHQVSKRSNVRNAQNFGNYSYNYVSANPARSDSVEIYAIRVEFKSDSANNTTGNGLFMRINYEEHYKASNGVVSSNDRKEFEWYRTYAYEYDRTPHDYTYFFNHLTALKSYFSDVSKEKIKIGFKIFPDGAFGSYKLSKEMALYSPGNKRKDETYDNYNTRKSRSMMTFVAEAISLADKSEKKPFADLQIDNYGNIYKTDSVSHKDISVFVLLIHAGSSSLTDNAGDSPNDLTDAFINEELFKYFNLPHENVFGGLVESDSFSGKTKTGVKITGKDNKTLILSELMMVSETANQDSLNWGINGILVNQFARQLGIPDLYSTSSGITGIGSFGIMDFAGYSAAQGFIPPNPSAFVRSFMGWDTPILVNPSLSKKNYKVKAFFPKNDSTLYLIPINSTEYYLVENRQRNLTGEKDLFAYDTINGKRYISSGFQINLNKNADSLSERSVVMKVKSRDIGIPASGVCLWHIDEKLLENRLKYNMVNSDSSYRAVNLVEADGITDIGVQFFDMLGYPWFDYGSAADVFPHTNSFDNNKPTSQINSKTQPATIANDGGLSFLDLSFTNTHEDANRAETYHYSKAKNTKFEDYSVTNYSDSTITMSVGYENENIAPAANFPIKIKGSGFFPLLTADVLRDGNGSAKEIVALSKTKNLSIVSEKGELLFADSVDAINMPTMVGNKLFIPCKNKIMIYDGEMYDGQPQSVKKDSITGINISTFIVGTVEGDWVAGTASGEVVFGQGKTIDKKKIEDSEISALAKFDENSFALISNAGNLKIVSKNGNVTKRETIKNATPPFKIIVFDKKIAVADGKHALWFIDNGIKSDWAGIFHESNIPDNQGYLSATDLNNDGLSELLIGGTNGVYAFDWKGNLLENYPALLDRAEWNIRKSVQATPISAKTESGETMVLFTTMTGDTKSYYQTKITNVNPKTNTVYFKDADGNADSIIGLAKGYIDTLLTYNDSIILPYYAPGGLIEFRDGKTGKRPDMQITANNAGKKRMFPYLISIGAPLSQGVIIDKLIETGKTLSLIAASDNGMLYRYDLPAKFPANQTDMTGGNAQRQFCFAATQTGVKEASKSLEYFYSYPNPVRLDKKGAGAVTFRYELGDNANSALLTIYTVQGQKVFEETNLRLSKGVNEFVLSNMSKFGSAVYRCRLSVKFGKEEKVLFWKMAVLK
jgi:hypothetical protein